MSDRERQDPGGMSDADLVAEYDANNTPGTWGKQMTARQEAVFSELCRRVRARIAAQSRDVA